jgi:hypothetical protein
MGLRKFLANSLLSTADRLEHDQTKEMLIADIRAARRKLADWIQPGPEVRRPPII